MSFSAACLAAIFLDSSSVGQLEGLDERAEIRAPILSVDGHCRVSRDIDHVVEGSQGRNRERKRLRFVQVGWMT